MVVFYPYCVLADAVCPYMQRIVDCLISCSMSGTVFRSWYVVDRLRYAQFSSKYMAIGGHIVDATGIVVH